MAFAAALPLISASIAIIAVYFRGTHEFVWPSRFRKRHLFFILDYIILDRKCHMDSGGVLNQIRGHVYHGLLGYHVSGRQDAITAAAAKLR